MTRHLTDPQKAWERANKVYLKMTQEMHKKPGFRQEYGHYWDTAKGGAAGVYNAGSGAAGAASGATTVGVGAAVGGAVGGAVNVAGHLAGAVATPLMVVNAAYHAKAVYSTSWHIHALRHMRDDAHQNMQKWRTTPPVLTALDYAIWQKGKKVGRRVVSAIPVVGISATVYGVGKWMYKKWHGKLGAERKDNASTIVSAFLLRRDLLALAMILELISEEEFDTICVNNHHSIAGPLLIITEEKLKST